MGIYWFLLIIIWLTGIFLQPSSSKVRKKVYICISFAGLFLISGFRAFSVGADTQAYVNVFNSISYFGTLKSRFEIGFLYYVQCLHRLSNNPAILLIISSAICIGVVCIFIYQFSENTTLSFLLYILLGAYFSQMNIMRQAIAMSLLMISYMILLTNDGILKRGISVLFVILASTFHTVAFVGLIPWILVARINKREERYSNLTAKRMLKFTIVVGIIVYVAYSTIMIIAIRFFPMYEGYFSGTWSDSNYNASLFNTLIQLVFAVAGAVVFKDKKLNRKQRFATVMLFFAIIFNILSMRMEIWGRIAGMFSIYTYLLWGPELTAQICNLRYRWLLNMIIVLFSAAYMLIILVYRPEWTMVVPYMFR